ncbi:MAG: PhnD/SsuA/transferrin family substrate-binding protein [Acidobacteria bacterium]|nr:PhnD/SsuA/transferrin family substrate-binding protein [Acidobacteriota bacterium]
MGTQAVSLVYRIWPAAGVWAILAALWPAPAPAQTLKDARLDVICSSSLFHTANPTDVVAAANVWLVEIGRRRGFRVDPHIEISNNFEEIRRRVADASVSIVLVDSIEYLKLAPLRRLKPVVTISTEQGRPAHNFLLVVRRDTGWTKLEDLKGVNINSYARTDARLGPMWLDVLLDQHHLNRQTFFGSITGVAKPSSACLPVFFKKADACLVDNASFELMVELNPQLGAALRAIASSPFLVEGVVAVHDVFKEFQADLIRSLYDLDLDPVGRQILMLFKGNHSMPITDSDLNPVRELWTKYLRLDQIRSGTASPAQEADSWRQ